MYAWDKDTIFLNNCNKNFHEIFMNQPFIHQPVVEQLLFNHNIIFGETLTFACLKIFLIAHRKKSVA